MGTGLNLVSSDDSASTDIPRNVNTSSYADIQHEFAAVNGFVESEKSLPPSNVSSIGRKSKSIWSSKVFIALCGEVSVFSKKSAKLGGEPTVCSLHNFLYSMYLSTASVSTIASNVVKFLLFLSINVRVPGYTALYLSIISVTTLLNSLSCFSLSKAFIVERYGRTLNVWFSAIEANQSIK